MNLTHIPLLVILSAAIVSPAPGDGAHTTPVESPATGMTLFDFADPDSVTGWMVVNDGVMGGKSKGGFDLGEAHLLFSGSTNTDGGGFSSIRGPLPDAVDLAHADGILLRVRAAASRTFQVDFRQKDPDRRYPLSHRAEPK